jgi:hypothetical protein
MELRLQSAVMVVNWITLKWTLKKMDIDWIQLAKHSPMASCWEYESELSIRGGPFPNQRRLLGLKGRLLNGTSYLFKFVL